MRFSLLGSGSRGNATLVQAGDTCIMLDCGFPLAETESRLERLAVVPGSISAILVTHEHGDHTSGVARFAARHDLPVLCTSGTRAACAPLRQIKAECLDPDVCFTVGDFAITPLTVPHDAREPTQFIFDDGSHRLGVLTDTGSITRHIVRSLDRCDGLILECNHDRELLENGSYPEPLKLRVGGPLGHLSNAQAAALLAQLDCGRLQHLVAAHLSEKNNTPQLACAALAAALGCETDWIQVATQDQGLAWRELS